MWTYKRTAHQLLHDDTLFTDQCYSGHGAGLNNPAMDDVIMTGPVPAGRYTVGKAFTHPALGPWTSRLLPMDGTDMKGRGGFCVHGDNAQHNESASEGCIVVENRELRIQFLSSPDRALTVVD